MRVLDWNALDDQGRAKALARPALLSDAGEFDDYDIIEDGRDGANRWRLDAYGVDAETRHLNMFISVFDDSTKPGNLTTSDLKGVLKKLISSFS